MEDEEYERICALDEFPPDGNNDQQPLNVSEENFLVIKRQVEHRRLRAALRLHRQDKTLKRYITRHGVLPSSDASSHPNGADVGKHVTRNESICSIATSVKFSPCMLARVLLEAKYGWSKTTISNLFKDIMNDRKEMTEREFLRLWREVEECIHHDPYCSPLADRIRHNMGLEYEYILIMKLRSRGLLFESEDALREKGLSKTPDVRLLLPIGVRDAHRELHIVNWIDSKAMFGDRHTHETENAGQLQGYVNRYGPGMVIYWFGHVARLSSEHEVFITDSFPRDIVLPGDVDPFVGQPPCLSATAPLPMRLCQVETVFDDDFQPMSTSHDVSDECISLQPREIEVMGVHN